jgi:hypothetical protein
MASQDSTYNFTGGVNIEQKAAPQNAFQRFVSGMEGAQMRTAERQERSRNPLYDLQKMMSEQRINSNALQLSDALYQKQLDMAVRGGQQKLNILFSNSLGKPDVNPTQLKREIFRIAVEGGLTDKEIAPYLERADFMERHLKAQELLDGDGLPEGWKFMPTVDEKGNTTWTAKQVTPDGTVTQRDLEKANKLEDMAISLEQDGYSDIAKRYRDDAGRLRSRVEGGPSSNQGFYERQIAAIRMEIADREAKMKAGQKGTRIEGAELMNHQKELVGLKAQLAQAERDLALSGGSAPRNAPIDDDNPLGLPDQ